MTHIFPILQSPSSCLSLDTFGITFYETRMKYVLAVSSARTVTMTRVRYSFFLCFIIYARVHYMCLYIHTHIYTHIYISSSFFSFTYEYTLRKSACRDRGKGQDRSIVKRRMKADLYCAREVNKAERIVTAASRYIVIYLNIIFPQRIEGIIVFAHITPYYQSSLVDVSTRDLLFFTYP